MEQRDRLLVAAAGTALLFVLVQVGALLLVEPFDAAGYQAVEDPSDPTNSLVYLLAILVMTGFILVVIRFGVEWVLRATVILMSALLAWYVFSVTVPRVTGLGGGTASLVAIGLAAGLGAALWLHPEWYVIDAGGVVIGAGAAGLFGISFGPLPALLLLGALAVYDAVAVYRTKHMLTLAESVTGLKLPLVLVVPLSWRYSFLDAPAVAAGGEDADSSGAGDVTEVDAAQATDADARSDDADASAAAADDEPAPDAGEPATGLGDREAFFIGLGDTVMPTILVASAAVFLEAPALAGLGAVNLPALGAMVGTLAGLAALLYQVAKGQAHAGLPLLNGGAIAGYLAGALAAGVPLAAALGVAPYL